MSRLQHAAGWPASPIRDEPGVRLFIPSRGSRAALAVDDRLALTDWDGATRCRRSCGSSSLRLYLLAVVMLGVTTLRMGHTWLFVFGSSCRSCGSSAH